MSKEIDEKVVSMKFDNKQFMDKTSESMTQIDKLKNSLRLTDAAKGFDDINNAAGKVDLNQIGTATEEVSVKFNALQIFAKRMLENIADTAYYTGKRIVSAFTIDPIKTGLQEYETQINAVQTILANTESKGTTLEDVNGALDKLNAYADKTIYNFTEMTRNIGTFTAAGVDLDTSVNAIQGIANLAAVSGSNSQQASTAMYQLSQALSSGTVKLMDWNSVVNAGMGGQVFQDALKETARVHDIAIDDMIEEQGSFRETLSEGWLTSEILTETLQKFTMATEGLTEEQIAQNRAMLKSKGYTDEQIDGIFKLGNTATNAATKVKTFTQLMDTLKEAAQSGWTQTWEILIGDFEEAKELWTKVSDVFNKIIGDSAEARNALLQGWADGGGRQAMLDSFVNVWKALVAIITPIKEAFREIFPPTTSEQLIKITEAIKNFTSKLILSEHAQEKLKATFKGLFAVLDVGWFIIKEIAKGAMKVFGGLLELVVSLTGGVNDATGSFGDWLVGVRDSVKKSTVFSTIIGGIVTVLMKLIDVMKRVVSYIKESNVLGKIVSGIATVFSKLGNVIKTVYSYLKENVRFPSLEGFLVVLTAIWNGIKWVFDKIVGVFKSVGGGLLDAFRAGDFKRVLEIFNTGVIGGILLGIKNFTDGFGSFKKGIKGIMNGVSDILDGVGECLEAFASRVKAAALLDIAKAMAILTAAIVVLSLLDPAKVNDSLGTITMLFIELMGAMAILSRLGGGDVAVFKMSSTLIGMSVAILILASALKKLSKINPDEMTSGLMGIAALAGVVIAFAKVMSKNEKTVLKCATSFIGFALSLKILVTVCEDLSKLSWSDLGKGLAGIAGFMLLITLFVNKTKMKSALEKTASGILTLSIAIKILAWACGDFAAMSWKELGKGLLGVVALLAALTAAVKFIPKDLNIKVMGLLGIVAAIAILSKVLESIGAMSIATIGKGLLALTVSLAALVVALNFMKGTMVASAALIVAAVALNMLVIPLRILGAMSIKEVGKSLIVLGGALAILAIAMDTMSMSIKGAAALLVAAVALNFLAVPLRILGTMNLTAIGIALLALAGTFVVLGLAALVLSPLVPVILSLAGAIALLGVGVLTVGLGMATFASGLAILAGTAAAAAAGLVAVAGGIIAALGVILTGIIGFGALIAEAIAALISGICNAIVKSIGAICNAIAAIIVAVCDALVKAMPSIIKLIEKLLDAVLDIILKYVPKIVDVALKLLIAILDSIAKKMDDFVAKGIEIVVSLIKGIGSQVGPLINAAFELILDLINGLADAIDTYMPQLFDACVDLGKSICEGIGYGIGAGVGSIWTMIKSVGKGIIDGFKKTLGINSPAKVMIPIGQGIDEGTALGMEKYQGVITDASEDVGKLAVESMSKAISGISDVVNSDIDSQPVIRPVLDLSGVESGANAINGMFGMTPSVDVLSNVDSINARMSNSQNGGNFDVISAIKDLGSKISGMSGNTYIVEGITYDDGSNVADAVESIIRAARIERRI